MNKIIFRTRAYSPESHNKYLLAKHNGLENPDKKLEFYKYRFTVYGVFENNILRIGFSKGLTHKFDKKMGVIIARGRALLRPLVVECKADLSSKDRKDLFMKTIQPYITNQKFNPNELDRTYKFLSSDVSTNRAAEQIHETIRQIQRNKKETAREIASFTIRST